nr:MAG TPA: hypothetical protein [Caudoviricetes sp.]
MPFLFAPTLKPVRYKKDNLSNQTKRRYDCQHGICRWAAATWRNCLCCIYLFQSTVLRVLIPKATQYFPLESCKVFQLFFCARQNVADEINKKVIG